MTVASDKFTKLKVSYPIYPKTLEKDESISISHILVLLTVN